MSDDLAVGALLLVAGPIVGGIGVGSPSLLRVWTASRDERLAIVAAHRTAWALANAGFVVATVTTAAGLALLTPAAGLAAGPSALLVAGAVAYAIGGVLWCALQAIRARTTPELAAMVALGLPTEPAERLLGAAMGGLFVTFALTTGAALVAIGLALLAGGGVAAPVAWLAMIVGAGAVVWVLVAGDMIPAVLYLPTLAIGLALLMGWS